MKSQPKSIWSELGQALGAGWAEIRGFGKSLAKRLSPLWRTRLALLIRIVLVAIIVTAIAGALAIYALGWENRFTRWVASYVPYPAAVSLHGFVYYSDYAGAVEQIKVYAGQTGMKIDDKTRNQQAMSQQLNNLAVELLAAQKKVTVSAADVTKEYNRIVQAYGGEKPALDLLRSQYGMSKSAYRNLIRVQLLYQKTEAAWAADTTSMDDAKSQASDILRQAAGGADFDALAARYSQDTNTAAAVDAATLPGNVAAAAGAVKDGELVDRPLEADDAFYVVKRIKTDGGKVMVRGIVIKPVSFGKRLSDKLAAVHPFKIFWPAR